MESRSQEGAAVCSAAKDRDVHLVVTTEVTVNLATIVSKVGPEASFRPGRNEAKVVQTPE